MPIVQFAPFSSLIQPSFWHELTNIKIDVLRLSDEAVPLSATYSIGRSIKDRETGQDIPLGCNLSVGSESFDREPKYVSKISSVSSQIIKRIQVIARIDHHFWDVQEL